MAEASETQITIDETIPRHQPDNPFGYDEIKLAERKKAIRDAEKDYPNVPPMWIEWMYDIIENTPAEEMKEIIKEKKWKQSVKERNSAGGVVAGSLEILEPENNNHLLE